MQAVRRELTPLEVDLLAEIVLRRAPDSSSLVDALRGGQLTDAEAEALLELVAGELAQRGFDADYEPMSLGVRLESLIDALNDA